MTQITKEKSHKWYNQRYWSLLLALLFLASAYAAVSRAIDTGSWQQYSLTFLFLVLGVNRLIHTGQSVFGGKNEPQ